MGLPAPAGAPPARLGLTDTRRLDQHPVGLPAPVGACSCRVCLLLRVLPAPVGFRHPAGLPTFLDARPCQLRTLLLFNFFFPMLLLAAPTATHASARLQIRTRKSIFSPKLSFLGLAWTRPCPHVRQRSVSSFWMPSGLARKRRDVITTLLDSPALLRRFVVEQLLQTARLQPAVRRDI